MVVKRRLATQKNRARRNYFLHLKDHYFLSSPRGRLQTTIIYTHRRQLELPTDFLLFHSVRSQVKVYHPANAKVYHLLHGY